MALYSSREFRRALDRSERNTLRNSNTDEMEELREELSYSSSLLDTSDPYIQELIRAIPSMSDERATEIINKEQ